MRAMLLYLVQNVDAEKLPLAYSLLSDWFNNEVDDWEWAQPLRSEEHLSTVVKVQSRVASPTFFDD
jgi:hypothetical protein